MEINEKWTKTNQIKLQTAQSTEVSVCFTSRTQIINIISMHVQYQ